MTWLDEVELETTNSIKWIFEWNDANTQAKLSRSAEQMQLLG